MGHAVAACPGKSRHVTRLFKDDGKDIELIAQCGAITAALDTKLQALKNALEMLTNAVLAGATGDVVTKILDLIIEFSAKHFAFEERLMRDQGFRDIDAHVAAHAYLSDRLERLRAAAGRETSIATLDAIDLVHDYLDHAAHSDQTAYEQMEQSHWMRGRSVRELGPQPVWFGYAHALVG
ncbi:MAG: hemerythrin family protein [Acidobacteriia bacterium]|nr:hemerythrin family protein [Terriglobia bacterium]